MKKGYNVYYLQKDIDNEVDSKTIFFTENKEFNLINNQIQNIS